jgi:glutamate formiminotransferase
LSGVLIESVPNFSEGRREEVVQRVAEGLRRGKGVRLLDLSSDQRHHR